eukprot:5035018-Amphidinium_carterae.1
MRKKLMTLDANSSPISRKIHSLTMLRIEQQPCPDHKTPTIKTKFAKFQKSLSTNVTLPL